MRLPQRGVAEGRGRGARPRERLVGFLQPFYFSSDASGPVLCVRRGLGQFWEPGFEVENVNVYRGAAVGALPLGNNPEPEAVFRRESRAAGGLPLTLPTRWRRGWGRGLKPASLGSGV